MIALVLRRARVQRGLLVAVTLLVATACTLVGTCTLLLDRTQELGFARAVQQVPPDDVAVTAFLVDVTGDAPAAAGEAADVVSGVLASLRPAVETTTTSRLRELAARGAEPGGQGYLVGTDDLAARADLTSGRWPGPADGRPVETVVPTRTAALLGLEVGDEVDLGGETGIGGVDGGVRMRLVGTFDPRPGVEWERDPLEGSGFSPTYSDGLEPAPTYGPFVVAPEALAATGSTVNALRVTVRPDLGTGSTPALRAAVDRLATAPDLLDARVGDRVGLSRVASDLPLTLDRLDAQQVSTRSTVLVVLLLGLALSLAAALMTGRLVGSVRQDERDLLVSWGLDGRQRLSAAATEAALVAVAGGLVAVPAAALVHARLTGLDDLVAAGLAQAPAVTPALLLVVGGTALALGAGLVAASWQVAVTPDPAPVRRVRIALDAVLVLVAGAAWWQLRGRAATYDGGVDVVLALAPVVCLVALTVVGTRLVAPVLARVGRVAVRSRALVVPVALQQAARRVPPVTATVLLATAVASAVLGIALRSTWERSQSDQAALRVGTDLALATDGAAGPVDAREVRAAAGERATVSPVIHRPLTLGRYVGREGSRPVLVAVDTRRAGTLLRGRTGDLDWSGVGARLAPGPAVTGLAVPVDGSGARVRGRAPAGVDLVAHPTVVLQDPTGYRFGVTARDVRLDGASHPLRWSDPGDTDLALVAVRLEIDGRHTDGGVGGATGSDVRLDVTLPSPAGGAAGDQAWRTRLLQDNGPVRAAGVTLDRTPDAARLSVRLDADLTYVEYGGADVLVTALPRPDDVPVAVSQALADAVGVRTGDPLAAVVGDATLDLVVAAVVPAVPSAPGAVAVLADADTLTRALVDAGRLEPVVDGWWVGRPGAGTAARLEESGLGTVTTRASAAVALARGPLRVAVPTTLLVLVVLASAMYVAALVLLVGSDRRRRTAEAARLRALGASRVEVRRLAVLEHLALVVPLTLVGAAVGGAAAVGLGPHLVRSDLGAAPVPAAVVAWPWVGEAALVAGMLVGAVVVSALLSNALVRRSDPARLGTGES